MASYGWQGIQATARYDTIGVNLWIESINHSGTTLTVRGAVQAQKRSGSDPYYYSAINAYPEGGSVSNPILAAYAKVSSAPIQWFTSTIYNVAISSTSYNFRVNIQNDNASADRYWTINFNSSATAPSGLAVTIDEIGKDYAVLSGAISSYGTPVADNSYMELAINANSTYSSSYRYQKSENKATSMNEVRIDNTDSTSTTALTIKPNSAYYASIWATNRSASKSLIGQRFITLPGDFTSVTTTNEGEVVTVRWAREAEGTAATIALSYSIDGGETWTPFNTNPFSFTASHSGQLMLKAANSTGSTTYTTDFIAESSHLYGSVDGHAKLLHPVYGSVNGTAREIKKLYIGDKNGNARKVIG